MKKVVFLGSKPIGYNCLNHLIENSEQYNVEIVAVLTNSNNRFGSEHNITELCESNGLEILDHPDQLEEIDEIDFLISVQYHLILKKNHIDTAKELAVNLHMAPLPEYRGCNQFSFAIIDGKSEFGTTLHVLNEGIDSGEILFEKRFPMTSEMYIKELYDITFLKSIELFEERIGDVLKGNYEKKAQEDYFESRSSSIHYRKEINQIKCIDLKWDEQKIDRHIRATSMPGFPPPFTIINGKKYELTLINSEDE